MDMHNPAEEGNFSSLKIRDLCKIYLSYKLAQYNRHQPGTDLFCLKDLVILFWEECRSLLIYILARLRYVLNIFR